MTSAPMRLSRVSIAAATGLALAAPAAAGSVDYYLKLPDIEGEAAAAAGDKPRIAVLEVQSFSWGEARAGRVAKVDSLTIKQGVAPEAKGKVEYTWKVEEGESAPPPPGEAEITLKGSKIGENSATKPKVSDITLKRGVDKASPALALASPLPQGSVRVKVKMPWLACRVGARYPELQLGGGGGATYTLTDVTVASCGQAAAGSGDRPTEEVAFYYNKISF